MDSFDPDAAKPKVGEGLAPSRAGGTLQPSPPRPFGDPCSENAAVIPFVGEGLAPSRVEGRGGGEDGTKEDKDGGVRATSSSMDDTPDAQPRRRRIRLDEPVYRETGLVFSVTIGTSPRSPVFEKQAWALECIEILRDLRREMGNPVYAYCLMPDHVHFLLATLASSPLSSFVGRWKSLCYQARRRRGNPANFWQKSFFERALRGSDDLRAAALYILNNPVRKGLVNDFHQYPLCGSLEWEL